MSLDNPPFTHLSRLGHQNDDPIESALLLDARIKEMMAAIDDKVEAVEDFRHEKAKAVNVLENALAHAQNAQIPF